MTEPSKWIMSTVHRLRGEVQDLIVERNLWKDRCAGALWLVPGEVTCGQLQEAARQASGMRAEIERLRLVEKAARTVVETFQNDEAQGYRSGSRVYALDMLAHHFRS